MAPLPSVVVRHAPALAVLPGFLASLPARVPPLLSLLHTTPGAITPAEAARAQALSPAEAPAEPKPLAKLKDSFSGSTSVSYLEELEERYHRNPRSVDRTWQAFFRSLEQGVSGEAMAEALGASEKGRPGMSPFSAAAIFTQTVQESMRLLLLIRAYQVLGHFAADLDPLGMSGHAHLPELDPAFYGFKETDLDREFFVGNWNQAGFLAEGRPTRTLREMLTRLQETYCGNIGYEYMHIPERDKCNWIRERIETIDRVRRWCVLGADAAA
ncbi:hypothetical protein GPECTOR_2g942 [Gonium pectorale]|uniref:2-oxoglutarate dehydrogenase, mitochondrial n=1 Tax=Gonium pectorale TaxID=33097 RepID=A0A150H3B4_GONPE|nr:hypothetical protein GPECTOR_2g942 [Gonium pectorale]|eukprot:KXZ56060.1 hypothetical protein GPECTOR_2g942 [Gonium pectorale]